MQSDIFDEEYTEANDSAPHWTVFVNIVRQLRTQCPWDRKQTHASLRHLLIEEAYEAIEALDAGDMQELRTELGDLLLQIVLHSVIAEETQQFDLAGVVSAVADKMVRRHPHVFGDRAVSGVEEVLQNWESLKASERQGASVLSGVPASLPALLCAYRMQEKAASVGFDFPDQESTWAKVEEEMKEFRAATSDTERENEFGDLLFALVNYARKNRINPEDALRSTNRRFRERLGYVETQVPDMKSADLKELDLHWEKSKDVHGD
ncbi:MAG: nucleoside triphosphate pyrophosphohydrolase [Rhodothermaceae bacterium]|nr:nucleoside triphosphate pyrophosphohydrolase [Rhodothermaceae bacterium]MXX59570.1 nucleoside triphosphate pyrophosphohydrolase [Rhodothermaceae bacterium]MYD19107.1 nucleoside triphosphate pyrophosphohydrolase [Rhodothermaceae bacterium]MYD56463.1 nucleoside triphosphate pyrophosphohydrolase [Rhodothermaceae bacterium]MYJ56120.1 nucleoside triphosphate pyrophosphohydrolase [Rhodothermaceae bacterium]